MEQEKFDKVINRIKEESKDKQYSIKILIEEGVEDDSEEYDAIIAALEPEGYEIIDEFEDDLIEFDDDEVIKIASEEEDILDSNVENVDLEKMFVIKQDAHSDNDLKEFLKEIGSVPLLKKKEEEEATQAIVEGVKAETILNKFKNGTITLTTEEIKDNALKVTKKRKARDRLILGNMRLVVSIAKGFYQNSKMSLQDLVSEGVFGLIKTIEKFDPSRGLKFSTYATPWIRQSISRAVAEKSRTVRIPVHVHERAIRINKAMAKLNQTLGRMPTLGEISDYTGVSEAKIVYTKLISRDPVSFESPAGDDDTGATILDLISDTQTLSPEQEYERSQIQEFLKVIFTDNLTPLQEKVITLKFGLFGTNQHSLDEISHYLDMPKTKIKMIEQKAIKVLRANSIKKRLSGAM
ncbi:MAG: sigma-70 family RNA polymerase sigma factor [Acholeplasmatales bacterium]|jgi:RNA polymerase primary sigma factor|nr:sigma-70 family RNA polymerase sigma factor [Acholeplasmatales bacterium]